MKQVFVWDLPTRVGHWLLAALIGFAWITSEWSFAIHTAAGYAVLAIVVFRLQWGVLGNERARFSDFIKPWPEVKAYALRLATLSPPRTLGHNPLGGWMIVVMLATVALVVGTGLFSVKRDKSGPLADLLPGMGRAMAEIHEGVASFMVLLIAVHVAAVVFDWLLTGDNLIKAMISGSKELRADEEANAVAASPAAPWRIALAAIVSVAVVYFLVAR